MHAGAVSLLDVFQPKQRLEVPLFQRQYVWNREHQWEPLWEDISRKFTERLDGHLDGPVHFLGAMVLDQKMTPTGYVARRQVIDGQQRLTTLQIFLAVFRDFCDAHDNKDLASETRAFTLNTGMMSDPDVDRFKVWPTSLDRPQFRDVMESGSRSALELQHPLVRQKGRRKYDPRPRMVEAYLFFYDQLVDFFLGDEQDPPYASDFPLASRLEECFTSLKESLQVVVIDLEGADDPQVIFETLNARGEPLLPADLLRNFIFLRAGRAGENQEKLYQTYWRGFDDAFWREEVRQGRLNRPRSDLFMQHFLASRLARDISAKHLYIEYKHWIETRNPFQSISEELQTLDRQGQDFRRLTRPKVVDPLYQLATFLKIFDMSTAYPLLLILMDRKMSDEDLKNIGLYLESYILRRALCGLTNKNYNRLFLALAKFLQGSAEWSVTTVTNYLLSLYGESSEWPSDEAFWTAWRDQHVYQVFGSARTSYLLRRLNGTFVTSKQETIHFAGELTVEHIMPRSWLGNWPLSNGNPGKPQSNWWAPVTEDEDYYASRKRDRLVETIGNLTLLTQPLNSSALNKPWDVKKKEIQSHSLLPINLSLQQEEVWDDSAIERRGRELFERARTIWPRPA